MEKGVSSFSVSVKIIDKTTKRRPLKMSAMIRSLLKMVPSEHMIGLESIVIVDQILDKRKDSLGQYRKGMESNSSEIWLSLELIFEGMPRMVLSMPFVPKFMLANVLYHEIGHHYRYKTHGISNASSEDFAEQYKKKLIIKAFKPWLIVLLPFRPLVKYLARR